MTDGESPLAEVGGIRPSVRKFSAIAVAQPIPRLRTEREDCSAWQCPACGETYDQGPGVCTRDGRALQALSPSFWLG